MGPPGEANIPGWQVIWAYMPQRIPTELTRLDARCKLGSHPACPLFCSSSFSHRYGKWGYRYGRAPFNVTRAQYEDYVDEVRDLPLADLYDDFAAVADGVQRILQRYAKLQTPSRPG
jgi:hypothetical protein